MVLVYNENLAEVLKRASVFLKEKGIEDLPLYDYWAQVFDQPLHQVLINLRHRVPDWQVDRFEEVIQALSQHKPIQYITSKAYFGDRIYQVNTSTLIPREDTYGILTLAKKYLNQQGPVNILDVGTGSGILAIELALTHPDSHVTGLDISPSALEVAKLNAKTYQVKVNFIESDLFSNLDQSLSFDLIVSNPPYISEDELEYMDQSVLLYEPKLALFAEEGGLALYKRIAHEAGAYLSSSGCLILEIGFRQGQSVKKLMLEAFPDAQVQVHQDLNGLDRYVVVERGKNEDPSIYKK